jgi:hypothetical protein
MAETEQYQSQLTQQNNPFMSPMNQYGSAILLLTNPEDELKKMELTLRGQQMDSEGNIIQVGNPLMNDEGINRMVGLIQRYANQSTVMSNLKSKDTDRLRNYIADHVAINLMINRERYNIKDMSARYDIFFCVVSTAIICLNRPLDEGERRFWKGQQPQEFRTIVEGKQQKGVLASIAGWAGNK